MRTTIEIRGAREHNLRNVDLELPRDKLIVVTGVSGSGKSSLAFDTLYAEGQRRYMDSLSGFVRQFLDHLPKPDVDFVQGLSPVISIEQKTVGRNPRSTVGTMTDIGNFVNLLYAVSAQAHCPLCGEEVTVHSRARLLEAVLSQPAGTVLELRVPVWPVYGEDSEFLLTEVRKRGSRYLWLGDQRLDLSETQDVPGSKLRDMLAVMDRLTAQAGAENRTALAIDHALEAGERFVALWLVDPDGSTKPLPGFGCARHAVAAGDLTDAYFMFNQPLSACRTCSGLGTYKQVHLSLLVPDEARSIRSGAIQPDAFRYNPDTSNGVVMHSLAQHYGFSVDTPWRELSAEAKQVVLWGTDGASFPIVQPPEARVQTRMVGQSLRYEGLARGIERTYRRYRQLETAKSYMEDYLDKVMVDHTCPDCGGSRLRASRLLFKLDGTDLNQVARLNFGDLRAWLATANIDRSSAAGKPVLQEILGRLDLLLGIGLDYLSFGRASATLSGGEAQRIRLSTQIGSGLMGMLYVLDEPSIGLHPKDNEKMIATLRRLRDLGNTVVVVEHDVDTIRAADHVVEVGPGPGVHGGRVVAEGPLSALLACPDSPTGQYLSGQRTIPVPTRRRAPGDQWLVIRGARENNLKNIDVHIPLGRLVCLTGASGSGKSTLATDILYNRLFAEFQDSRRLSGDHDAVDGLEHLSDVVAIDQTAIGRSPRSNPATYVGFYDAVRNLFAGLPESLERGYGPGRFSFNVKGGRCEECQGGGTVTTHLHFMPDVEVRCEACHGLRFNEETLEIAWRGKNIADVLNLSVEDGLDYFRDQAAIYRKVALLDELGLGYLTLGQSSTTLSGGEAQRIKLAHELSKLRRGKQVLYILDEPTTGLHLADIDRLLHSLNRLVEAGHSVLVIEHHLDVIKTADWLIDLGPEGGHGGGQVVATGTPEEVADSPESHTGRYLRGVLGGAVARA